MSHQAYGPRVGVPRILALLERIELRATFFFPGATAERWPATLEAVLPAGHEVALHSYHHRPLVELSEAEQEEDFHGGLEVLRRAGASPVGYRAPLWQQTAFTLDLVPRRGLRYDSSLMDDDRPYVIDGAGRAARALVARRLGAVRVPARARHRLQHRDPGKVLELWTGELDAMRSTGSLCMVCCHPFLSGRPSRLRTSSASSSSRAGCGDVELLTCGEIAERVLSA